MPQGLSPFSFFISLPILDRMDQATWGLFSRFPLEKSASDQAVALFESCKYTRTVVVNSVAIFHSVLAAAVKVISVLSS